MRLELTGGALDGAEVEIDEAELFIAFGFGYTYCLPNVEATEDFFEENPSEFDEFAPGLYRLRDPEEHPELFHPYLIRFEDGQLVGNPVERER